MARRRLISQNMIYDEQFNCLTIEAQNLFVRMLVISDDFGVCPATPYTLRVMVNPPERLRRNLTKYLNEIVEAGLGSFLTHDGQPFFLFKRESFDHHQSYILNKRTRSEYLRMTLKEFRKFLEVPGNSQSAKVERRKKKEKSSEKEAEDKKQKEEAAKRIYEYYRLNVRSGAKKDSINSIVKLLGQNGDSGTVLTEQVLMHCIDNYRLNGMQVDPKYRIQGNNFFGEAGRYEDYLGEPKPQPSAGPQFVDSVENDPNYKQFQECEE